ncbi:MAG: hypothetical protein EPO32_13535 [Anaerolineae bacterium]|nr:MAG: hypothetical protein EPO32_13535 [Anaerolineae bacterium]
MTRKVLLTLFVLSFAFNLGVAAMQPSPGYMDAAYYFSGAARLAGGEGFTEVVLWNYLSDPQGLPQPSHGYWMPLTSVVAAIGIRLLPFVAPLRVAQGVMALVAAASVVVTALLAQRLTGDAGQARLAGIFALLAGFYAPFLPAVDAFGLYMLLGGLFLLAVAWLAGRGGPGWIVLGALAGLCTLARADGLLWLAVVGLAALWLAAPAGGRARLGAVGWVALGFILAAGPWLVRNEMLFGTPLSPGGGRALWLLNYDELFIYPASQLTLERWLAAGPSVWLANWGAALGANLQTALVVHGLILLGPLAVWGGWSLRDEQPAVKVGALAYAFTFLAMTLVFPFAGARGGFFHSGAAVMPLVYAVVPVGLARLAGAYTAWRGRPARPLRTFFTALALVLALVLNLFALNRSLVGWDSGAAQYREVDARLVALGAGEGEIVIVNNPPAYYVETGRPAIVVPDANVAGLAALAGRYGARWLLLDENVPAALAGLAAQPRDVPGLRYVESFAGLHIFKVIP